MLTIEERGDGILHIIADAQLTTEEYAEFVPRFERLATPAASILIELGPGFTGWTLGGLWRDFKFDVEHQEQFGRMAVVGDKAWEKWGTEASGIFFAGEVRFFERVRMGLAEQWLREKTAAETAP